MSTQSFIGVLCKEGIIKFVYCHSDGYPSYLGRMLLTHYNTPELATALVDLGSLSMVRERLAPDEGETHTFDTPVRHGPKGGVTTAYHRDRGEDLEIDSIVVDTPVALKNAETLFLNILEEENITYGYYHHVVPQHKNGSNTIDNIIGLCTQHHDLVHKDATWQKRLAKKKTGLNKKYGALSVLNQIIPALTKELSSLFPKHFFVTNGKSTYDYRAAHGVSKDHWLDAYCIACSVLPNDTCDKTINSRVPYELKHFRRHDRRALNNENMSRVYTFNGKMVATNRHKATEQTTDSLEEFRQRQPNDVCNLKVKEHHPTYRNMNRNYPGSVFLVGNQVHVMQGIAGSKDREATTYKDTNANSIAAGKCKFVAKNSGILFV